MAGGRPVKRLLALMVAVCALIVTANPVSAHHDLVYAPCDPEDGRPVAERVWFIDYQSGDMLRFDDPWWRERPGDGYTNWHHQCRLGATGVWQAAPIEPLPHPPTHAVETRTTPTTTTAAPAATTTTTTTTPGLEEYELPDGYDLHTAEYDGWPFEQTIVALEARYPPGTPGKKHFPLSAAVRFLQAGGKVGGLDFLWNSAP